MGINENHNNMKAINEILWMIILCDFHKLYPSCFGQQLQVNNIQLNDPEDNTKYFWHLASCFFQNAKSITSIVIENQSKSKLMTDKTTELITCLHYHLQVPIMLFFDTTEANVYSNYATPDSKHDILFVTENPISLTQYLFKSDNRTCWHATDNFYIMFTTVSKNFLDSKIKYHELFQSLWEQYHITDVIIVANHISQYFWQGLRTCVLTFNPFLSVGKIKGMVQVYRLTEAHLVCQMMATKLDNLYGYPIRITMFVAYPFATPVYRGLFHPVKIGGVDGRMLNLVAQHMNFSVILQKPFDNRMYGFKLKNGTYAGSIGDIVYNRSDIIFNSHYVKNYDDASIQFLVPPVLYDSIVILVPKSQLIPRWMDLFQCFDWTVWLFIFVSYLVSVCFGTFLNWIFTSKINYSVPMCIIKMFFSVPVVKIRAIKMSSERLFAASCLLFGVFMVTVIQGSLVTKISKPNYYSDIDTLEQLVKSELPIAVSYHNLMDTFSNIENPAMITLANKIIYIPSSKNVKERVAYKRDIASITSYSNVPYFLEQYVGKFDKPLLHEVKEHPRSYYLSYITPKYSPFVRRLNTLVSQILESGLVDKWNDDSVLEYQTEERHNHTHRKMPTLHAYSLEDLQTAFFVLITGLVCGGVTFVGEVLMVCYVKS